MEPAFVRTYQVSCQSAQSSPSLYELVNLDKTVPASVVSVQTSKQCVRPSRVTMTSETKIDQCQLRNLPSEHLLYHEQKPPRYHLIRDMIGQRPEHRRGRLQQALLSRCDALKRIVHMSDAIYDYNVLLCILIVTSGAAFSTQSSVDILCRLSGTHCIHCPPHQA
ncbi:hypothetical protein BC834DRAFT_576313 [Gloeopeniophorella convolvens]|nr:hypothetical protein BC834DRAFT_576313 [Gloeopeniophorella convolvens]